MSNRYSHPEIPMRLNANVTASVPVGFRNIDLPYSVFHRQRGQQGHEGTVDGFQVQVAALECLRG
jgi:hypothetical protein